MVSFRFYRLTLDAQINHLLYGFFPEQKLIVDSTLYAKLEFEGEPTTDKEKYILGTSLMYMEEEGLIRLKFKGNGNNSYDEYVLTIKGYRIREKDKQNWFSYIEDQNKEKELVKQQKESTIAANELSGKTIDKLKESNIIQKVFIAVTVGAIIINMIFSILTYNKPIEIYILSEPQSGQAKTKLQESSSLPNPSDSTCDSLD